MSNTSAADWSNYWRGRTGEQTGAALVGAGIEHDRELVAFWKDVFEGSSPDARVLDLACGAGSALKQAAAAEIEKLAGADISADALTALSAAIPNAVTTECSAADTPFEEGIFDIIVSQFGIEYAGLSAATAEVARLLAPGGKFTAIVHLSGGGIAEEVERNLEYGRSIQETNFIPLVREVFITAQNPPTDENMVIAQKASEAFIPAEQALAKIAMEKGGISMHLYSGAKQMHQRVMNYALSDILSWLDGMQAEIDAYTGRMASMIEAAATEDDVRAALQVLQAAGCDVQEPERLQLDGKDAAWVLRAVRS